MTLNIIYYYLVIVSNYFNPRLYNDNSFFL